MITASSRRAGLQGLSATADAIPRAAARCLHAFTPRTK